MNEPSHSDEELLALLQPPSLPEGFDFESHGLLRDTSDGDDDHDQPFPGPAPPAPMAPMMVAPAAPMAPMELANPTDQIQPGIASSNNPNDMTNGFGSSQPEPDTNGQKEEDGDEDEIAYEPVKTPSRTPRSARSRTSASKPGSRRKLVSSRARWRPQDTTNSEAEENTSMTESMPKTEKNAESVSELEPEPAHEKEPSQPPSLEFEIVINSVAPQAMQEYKPIPPGDYIYRVLERIPTGVPGETWLSVEFEDGHIDQVSTCVRRSLLNRKVSRGRIIPLSSFYI